MSSARHAGSRRAAVFTALLLSLPLMVTASCGDDDLAPGDAPGGGASGGTTGSDASVSGGTTASGGTASGGTPATGGTAPLPEASSAPPPVECNGKTCALSLDLPEAFGALQYENCCYDGKYCGFRVRNSTLVRDVCVPLAVPGTLNPDCPGVEVERNAVQRYGCCLENGTCGAFGTPEGVADLGCVDPVALQQPQGPPCNAADTCSPVGSDCTTDRDCCALPRGTLCVDGTCRDRCATPAACESACCRFVSASGKGACSPAEECAGTCGELDADCLGQQDCCDGLVCARQFGGELWLCSEPCGDAGACPGEQRCVLSDDAAKTPFCAHERAVECSDTCATSRNGACDDGGTGAAGHACAYGSDCADCGPRTGGFDNCTDRCRTAKNGTCEDGGPSSDGAACPLGSDCSDCGVRREVCTEVCAGIGNGLCEDGSARSTASDCSLGTDCDDCTPRLP